MSYLKLKMVDVLFFARDSPSQVTGGCELESCLSVIVKVFKD